MARTASATACPHDAKQRHRLRYALEFMAAAFLDNEQAGNLALQARGDHNRTRIGQRLSPSSDVWHIAENLARRIDYHRPRVDSDPRGQRRLA